MPHQVTVTAKTGPDRQVTAQVLLNVLRLDLQLADRRIQIHTENIAGNQIKEFELGLAATITAVNTSGNWAITIA